MTHRRYMWTATAVALMVLFCASVVSGHDFWIELSQYQVKPAESVNVLMRLGHNNEVTPVERRDDRIKALHVVGKDVDEKISGKNGEDPAGTFELKSPGYYVVAYESTRSSIELDGKKFTEYLVEEGLEKIMRKRMESGESDLPGKEVYSRSVKTILKVGEPEIDNRNFDRRVGLPVEITPLSDPFHHRLGSTMEVIVEYNKQPLESALIEAFHRNEKNEIVQKITMRTNRDGKAYFPLNHAGVWMFACTNMVEAPDNVDADWESFWGALTIEVPTAQKTGPPEPATDK